MAAGFAPYDEPNTGGSRAAQRRWRTTFGFHPIGVSAGTGRLSHRCHGPAPRLPR
jgi:hypothetical protein